MIGGGPVGCELAQAYRSLGADVTLLEYGERLLPRDEAFAGETIRAALVDGGVEVRLGARIDAARREPGGDVVLTLAGGEELRAQEVLVAAGRRPLTEDLGLETVGLTSGGPIEVGDDLRVPGSDWLYVLGDANGRVLLTHMGKYQARLAADRIAGVNRPLLSDGRPLAAGHLHRAPGRGRRPHARLRPRGRPRRDPRRGQHVRDRRRQLRRQGHDR